MSDAGEHPKRIGIGAANRIKLVVGAERQGLKCEDAVLGGFRGENDPWKVSPRSAKLAHRLTEQPPVLTPRCSIVQIALGLHSVEQPLVQRRVLVPCLLSRVAEQVDDEAVLAALQEVPRIAVRFDDRGQVQRVVPQCARVICVNAKALAHKVHALEAKPGVGCQSRRPPHRRTECQVGVHGPRTRRDLHFDLTFRTLALGNDGPQLAFDSGCRGNRHRDPHRGVAGAVDPRVVGHSHAQTQWRRRQQVPFNHATIEGLSQAVRRDETEAPDVAASS